MKCINKCVILFVFMTVILTGCGSSSYQMPYDINSAVSGFSFYSADKDVSASSFAEDLCVTSTNVTEGTTVDTSELGAVLLCDLTGKEVIYAKSVHDQMAPASLTKVMTALVALKHGKLDDVLTASDNVVILESGASMVGIKPGDTLTLDQALYALLVSSGNDAAVLIAESIGGSIEAFCEMMNTEAKALGATNCNFVNPHGLTAESHYVTAYDMYLIFNKAIENEKFIEIINTDEYTSVYHDEDGDPKNLTCTTSNLYLKGNYQAPEHVTVIGGKTGTTQAAGNCLVLLTKDTAGKPYISVILRCGEREIMYNQMSDLLNEITN